MFVVVFFLGKNSFCGHDISLGNGLFYTLFYGKYTAIYENTSVTMTCNIFQCASASKPISLYTVSRNIFMRTSQTHHYEFNGQTGDTGTNRFELKIYDFFGNKQTESMIEQKLKYEENDILQ